VAAAVLLVALVGVAVAVDTHPATAETQGQAIVNAAASQSGIPYCDGGGGIHGPSQPTDGEPECPAPGYDCMSLAQYAVYQVTGYTVPANGEELPGGTDWDGQGAGVGKDQSALEPGDVVFFGGSDLWHYAHSGIYAGDGEVWDALQTGTPVGEHTMADLTGIYTNYQGGVRYLNTAWTPPSSPTTPTGGATPNGYDLVGSDGGVFVFGGGFYGSLPGLGVRVDDITGIVPNDTDTGYFLVGSDGGVFAFNAPFSNSLPGLGVHVNDIAGIVPTLDDGGYFLVGRDGGVFSFNAPFENSLPGLGISVDDITGIAATPDDNGYWLVGSDGAVYAFGDAHFYGAAPAGAVGITATHDGGGYWVVGANGAVTRFGDAGNFSDLPAIGVAVDDIVSLVVTADSQGYNLIGSDGGVFSFGDAVNRGSLPGLGVHVDDVVGAVPT
jgi:cell wall-associated NlpC family hydrolase